MLHSLTVKSEKQSVDAAKARQRAVAPWLPSNPVLSLSASRRGSGGSLGTDSDVTNWYATLQQEFEIANQRGARIESAGASLLAQQQKLVAVQREVAVAAWSAYFDAIAAEQRIQLAKRIETAAKQIATVMRARVEQGLAAMIEAQLADAAAMRAAQVTIEAERTRVVAFGRLAILHGRNVWGEAITVQGALEPLADAEKLLRLKKNKPLKRPEVSMFVAQSKASALQATVFRRARVPNPTLSGFIQNDGFNERVLGLGLAFPIPLPHPVGRTFSGEIAEARALSRRAHADATQINRELQLRFFESMADYRARNSQLQTFTPSRTEGASRAIDAIAEQIQQGRLSLRDALLTQQSLIEMLQSHLTAQLALCQASVALVHAAGLPLERGTQ